MNRTLLIAATAGITGLSLFLLASGCHKTTPSDDAPTTQQPSASPSQALYVTTNAPKGGALFWSQNCMRCHNLRRPRERSDRAWEVVVHHMRVRANLTAEEHRLILQFLKSAN